VRWGCALHGHGGPHDGRWFLGRHTKITQDDVNHIVKARTTRAQLEALLGPPNCMSMMGNVL
jgi:hypothetical protein